MNRNENRTNITFTVDNKLYNRIAKYADKSGITIAGLTRFIMEQTYGVDTGIRYNSKRRARIQSVVLRVKKGTRIDII